MTKVVLAEKKTVADQLAKVLGATQKEDGYWSGADLLITWAQGHLVEMGNPDDIDPVHKVWSLKRLPIIPDEFVYMPPKTRSHAYKQYKTVLKLLNRKDIDEVVNACDAAREGELIFHRIHAKSTSTAPLTRLWLQSLTRPAVVSAWENRFPASEKRNLLDAAICRSEADWLIGMNGTRAATRRLPRKKNEKEYSLSVGRVQTPTLKMLVSREMDILAFQSQPFWELEVSLETDETKWQAKWERQKQDGEDAEKSKHRIFSSNEKERLEGVIGRNSKITAWEETKQRREAPPMLFDLALLQRSASRRWHWSAKRTLDVAQELYDGKKLITYPRTDSRHLPEDMTDEVDRVMDELSQLPDMTPHVQRLKLNGLSNVKRNHNDKKVSDHFAIIPTGQKPSGLRNDEKKLFDLICRQFISAYHPESVWEDLKRIAEKEDEFFTARFSILLTQGWREVMPVSNSREPEQKLGATDDARADARMTGHEFKEDMTKPPSRFTDGGLLRLMEAPNLKIDSSEDDTLLQNEDVTTEEMIEAMKGKGLGTPATRADTIEKLEERRYIDRIKGGRLKPTPRGIQFIRILTHLPLEWLTSPRLTGEMEHHLKMVEEGKLSRDMYMDEVKKLTHNLIDEFVAYKAAEVFSDEEPVGTCPKCGKAVNETPRSYQCLDNQTKDSPCDFIIWKEMNGRYIDRFNAGRILEEKEITDLHGFIDASGREYTRNIALTDGVVRVIAPDQSSSGGCGGEEPNPNWIEIDCIRCGKGSIVSNGATYCCTNEDCKVQSFPTEICNREMSIEEVSEYFREGKTKLCTGFTSRYNRPFDAILYMDKSGRRKFEFENKGGDDLPKYDVCEGVVAICPKHKAEIIETDTHFTATEGSDCELHIPRTFSKRELTREEAKTLIEKGEVGPIENFTSKKTGKPFVAILYIDRRHRTRYKFPK